MATKDEGLFDAPEASEVAATGYAIYDRTLGQYVGPVHRDKAPTAEDARSAVPKGHKAVVVRV